MQECKLLNEFCMVISTDSNRASFKMNNATKATDITIEEMSNMVNRTSTSAISNHL